MSQAARPRPKKSDRTRAAILDAARRLFAERGFEGATVRDIAGAAAIDPAMVIRYFGSKDALFAQTASIRLDLPRPGEVDPGEIGGTLARRFLAIWEGPEKGGVMAVMLRSAAANEVAAQRTREVFAGQVMPVIAAASGDPASAARRAGLVSSQLLGLALCRYVLKLPPVVAMTPDEIVAWIGPTLQRYATGPEPGGH